MWRDATGWVVCGGKLLIVGKGNIVSIELLNCDYKTLINRFKKENTLIDLVLTDPPYCVSRDYQLGFSNMGRSGMNYGKWDYNFNPKEWIYLTAPFVRKGGSLITFNDWKNLSYVVEVLEENGFLIKDLIRWEKRNPMPRNVNSRYVMDIEVAVWAVKGKGKWTFNKPENVSYLKPVISTGVVPGGKKRLHPTQKHLEVIEKLVEVHSNAGDLIFDPFAGAGTMALACQNLDRNFIGSEIDKGYYKKAMERLCTQTRLVIPEIKTKL